MKPAFVAVYPAAILLTALLLGVAGIGGRGDTQDRVVLEVIGYTANRAAPAAPVLAGSVQGGLRLHGVSTLPDSGFYLIPPVAAAEDGWRVLPARPGVRLRTLRPAEDGSRDTPVPSDSVSLWSAPLDDLAGKPATFTDGVRGGRAESRGQGARVDLTPGGRTLPLQPWEESVALAPWLPGYYAGVGDGDSLYLGIAALVGATRCTPPACVPPEVVVREGGEEPVRLAMATLHPGELLRVQRQHLRFDVPRQRPGMPGVLQLQHVHRPLTAVLPAAARADLYHPNGLTPVPACGPRRSRLTLRPTPPGGAHGQAPWILLDAASLAPSDTAPEGTTVPSPSLPPGAHAETELLGVCWSRPHPGSAVLQVWKQGAAPAQLVTAAGSVPLTGPASLPLGSRERPREARVDVWGSLLRFAPDTTAGAQAHLRWGVAVFLALVLLLQAAPEAWGAAAAETHLRPLRTAFRGVCCLVAFLLLVGADFQARLAFDPRLAGTYAYLQEFLRGIVIVSLVLTAARWALAAGGSAWNVLWRAGMGALACLVLGRLFWAGWDSLRPLPEGFWISRGQQTATPAHLSLVEGGAALVWLLLPLAGRAAARWTRREPGPTARERRPRPRLSPQAWGWMLLVLGAVAAGVANRWFLRNSMLLSYFALAALWAWAGGTRWEDTAGSPDSGRRPAIAWLQVVTAGVALLGVPLFFGLGATLPPALSQGLVVLGLVLIAALWGWLLKRKLRRTAGLYLLWGGLVIAGLLLGVVFLKDLGAPTVWMPGLVVGFLVCSVKPERELHGALDLKRAGAQLALMGVLVMVSLAAVNAAQSLVEQYGSDSVQVDRVRTRFQLANDASYLTEGEWVAQVRTLAAGSTPPFWVPNLNSDVALYGVRALVGPAAAVAVSLAVIVAALLLVRCAEHTLRQGDQARDALSRRRANPDPHHAISAFEAFRPLLCWSLGIFGYMVAMMLVAQWLVHLITGISLHLPITGVALPWVSAGNGTHLAFTLAIAAFVVGVRCAGPPPPAPAP